MRSEDQILHALKSRGPQPTAAIARQLAITLPGARKHLLSLARQGLVASEIESSGVGRPKRFWRLTSAAETRFPDTHAFLTLELIGAARDSFGAGGLERLIAHREKAMRRRYGEALSGAHSLGDRVKRLAKLRSQEGYMAECSKAGDGSYILAENHCPICAAARTCQGFCRSELSLFSDILGSDVSIERIEHIVTGARRCAYRIARRTP